MNTPFATAAVSANADARRTHGTCVPFLIVAISLIVWFGFQVDQSLTERDALRAAMSQQEKPLDEAKKMRVSLDAIARDTARLAERGNPNARMIIDELARRGITVAPDQAIAPDGSGKAPQ